MIEYHKKIPNYRRYFLVYIYNLYVAKKRCKRRNKKEINIHYFLDLIYLKGIDCEVMMLMRYFWISDVSGFKIYNVKCYDESN